MIRTAKAGDIPGMLAVLKWGYDHSREAGRLTFDDKEARSLLLSMVQRNMHKNEGGTFLAVSEHDGEICGLIGGITARYYEIAKELVASDVWWLVTDKAPERDGVALFLAFDKWAASHPKVARIMPGISRMMGIGHERKKKVLEYLGYEDFGHMFIKETRP